MNNLYLKAALLKTADGKIQFVASDETVDRSGESIPADTWDLSNYLKSPRLLVDHDYRVQSIVGVAANTRVEEKKLVFEPVFHELTEMAKTVKRMVEEGVLDTVSVGFLRKQDEKGAVKNELMEISFVAVPANPNARMLSADELAVAAKSIEGFIKEVVPAHMTPMMDMGDNWDGAAAEANIRKWASSDQSGDADKMDWEKYSKGFGWYDAANKETFGAYKLPHHDIVDGELKVNWSGLVAAMGALMGARGGVEIPESEWDAVYNHLAEHYKQFEKEPPQKAVEPEENKPAAQEEKPDEKPKEEEGKGIDEAELKAGRVISSKNRAIIQASLEAMSEAVKALGAATTALEDLLASSEPSQGDEGDGKATPVTDEKAEDSELNQWIEQRKVLRAVATALGDGLSKLKLPRN